MLTNSTWGWVDEWLEGVSPKPSGANLLAALSSQRFLVARLVAALAGLVALFPLALIHQASPGLLEGAATVFVVGQIAAVLVLLRFHSLDAAQAVCSTVLAGFVALASREAPLLAALTFALAPLEAAAFGTRRVIVFAATLTVLLVALAPFQSTLDVSPVGMEILFGSGIALLLGHMAAHAFSVRRVEDALRRAALSGESREADLLATIDDVVTWHDGMGAVLRASSGSVRVLGAPAATLRGIGLFQRIHVTDRPAYLKALSDAAHGSKTARARLRVRAGASDAEPATVWLDMRAYRLPPSDGEKAIVVSVMRDIGEHQIELDDATAFRREAVAAAEHRARLLEMAGRALRKPLSDIHGYAQIMTGRGVLKAGVHRKDYADIMTLTAERMTETVGAFLELSSVESGARVLSYESIDVAAFLDECCESMAQTARHTRVTVRRDFASALPRLHADRKALEQVTRYALSNALTLAEAEDEIVVGAHVDGRNLSFSIGTTRRTQTLDAIKNAQDAEAELRLALVRALAELHGGRVSVTDPSGQGMHIHIDLPIEMGRSLSVDDRSNVRSIINSDHGVHLLKAG